MFSQACNNRVDITILVLAPAPYLARLRILVVRLSPPHPASYGENKEGTA